MFVTNKNNNLLFLLSVLAMSILNVKPTIALENCPTPFKIGQRCTDSAVIEVSRGPDQGGVDKKTISIEPMNGWVYVPNSIRIEKTKPSESPSQISASPVASGNNRVSLSQINNSMEQLNRIFKDAQGKVQGESAEVTARIYGEYKKQLEESQKLVEQISTNNNRIEITASTSRKCVTQIPVTGGCLDYVGRYAGWRVYADFVYVGTNQEINNITQKATQEMLALASQPKTPSSDCGNNIEIRPTNRNLEFPRGTSWETCNGYLFIFQDDGNLVLYNRNRKPLWASNTRSSNPPDILAIQTDGNVVLYRSGSPVWASGTDGNPGSTLAIQTDGNVVIYAPGVKPIWQTNTRGE